MPEVSGDWFYSALVRPYFPKEGPTWVVVSALLSEEGPGSLELSQLESTEVTRNRTARVYKECTHIHYVRSHNS